MRGLKFAAKAEDEKRSQVASHADAWIEISITGVASW